jgi:anti-sigma B factor antagonist
MTRATPSVSVVELQSKALDASNSAAFKESLREVIAGQPQLVLDLTQVGFVDSSGLGAILSALRQANAAGGDIKLARLNRPVRVVVELTRMHRIFEIFESVDAAVSAFDA